MYLFCIIENLLYGIVLFWESIVMTGCLWTSKIINILWICCWLWYWGPCTSTKVMHSVQQIERNWEVGVGVMAVGELRILGNQIYCENVSQEECFACLWSQQFAFVVQGRLSASGVGSLVELQSEQIHNIAAHYADKVLLCYISECNVGLACCWVCTLGMWLLKDCLNNYPAFVLLQSYVILHVCEGHYWKLLNSLNSLLPSY